jgi:hypothetical protein
MAVVAADLAADAKLARNRRAGRREGKQTGAPTPFTSNSPGNELAGFLRRAQHFQ